VTPRRATAKSHEGAPGSAGTALAGAVEDVGVVQPRPGNVTDTLCNFWPQPPLPTVREVNQLPPAIRVVVDLNAALARMLRETAPAAAHVQDAIARPQSACLDGEIQLAGLGRFQCLVVALEHRLRVATGRVEKFEIEVIVELIVGRDRLPVCGRPSDEPGSMRRHR
jgi:hypothetical protein